MAPGGSINIATILAGPHLCVLDAGDAPLVVIEPLRFIPITDHRQPPAGEPASSNSTGGAGSVTKVLA